MLLNGEGASLSLEYVRNTPERVKARAAELLRRYLEPDQNRFREPLKESVFQSFMGGKFAFQLPHEAKQSLMQKLAIAVPLALVAIVTLCIITKPPPRRGLLTNISNAPVAPGSETAISDEFGSQVTFSRNGERLAFVTKAGTEVKIVDLGDGTREEQVIELEDSVAAMDLSDDGTTIAVGNGNKVSIFEAGNGAARMELSGHVGKVRNVQFLGDGNLLVFDETGSLTKWNPRTGAQIGMLSLEAKGGNAFVSVSPDGTFALVGQSGNRNFSLVELEELNVVRKFSDLLEGDAEQMVVALGNGGQWMVVGMDSKIVVYKIGSGRQPGKVIDSVETVGVRAIHSLPGASNRVWVGKSNGMVTLYEMVDEKLTEVVSRQVFYEVEELSGYEYGDQLQLAVVPGEKRIDAIYYTISKGYLNTWPLRISLEARDHIVKFETGGRTYYEENFEHPRWSGYSSGVTVGFGYDLGYHSEQQIMADWAAVAPPDEIQAMLQVQGVTGSSAKYRASNIRNQVQINWDEAIYVFDTVTLPRWSTDTSTAYSVGRGEFPPDCNGALVGNTFNRGTGISSTGKNILSEKQLRRDNTK